MGEEIKKDEAKKPAEVRTGQRTSLFPSASGLVPRPFTVLGGL